MKILTVGYLHGAGGAERQIILLSNQLAVRGFDVTLCILAENKSKYPINDDVKIVDLSKREGKSRLHILKRLLSFRKCVNKVKPDVIVNYNLQSAYFCLTLSKNARGKVVYSERGDPYDDEYSGILGFLRDYTVRKMDGLVFQSEGARDFFPSSVIQKSIVIHNSVNIPQNQYPMPNVREKRIVSVGRLHHQKNPHLLIDAFARIANRFIDYTFDIYGDGELRKELQDHIDRLALHNRIHLIPSRSDVFDCIYKASLFVLASDYEGMPNALMEAMALGLPCISTDCRPGGARTLIEDGVSGVIVPCRDVEKLSGAMEYVLNNPDKGEMFAQNARLLQNTHTDFLIFNKWSDYINYIKNEF